MNRKTLFLVSGLVRQGPITQLMALLRHLPAMGVRSEVVTLDSAGHPDIVAELADMGVPVTQLPGSTMRQRGRAMKALLAAGDVGVVVSSGLRPDLVNRRFGPRGGRVAIKHEPAFTPWKGRRVGTVVVRSCHLLVLAGMDHLISVSRHVHDSLPSVLRRRSTTVRNGVDVSRFRPPSERERELARSRVEVDEQERVLAFVGSLDGRKRPHLILEPLRRLTQEGHRVRLLVAGEGPMKQMLTTAREDGLPIEVLGFRDDVREVFWSADALILPSTHEGLPMAAMEAMACGVPVVLSNIAPHVELLDGTRDAGEICDPEDPAALTGAIERILNHPGGYDPHRVAMQRYSSTSMARTYADILQQIPS